ncbi:MAG: zinc-dependent metalloprotease [Hyphomonas sp.]
MRFFVLLAAACLWLAGPSLAQDKAAEAKTLAERVAGMDAAPGFLDLHVDAETGHVFAALPAPGADGVSVRFIYATGLTAGLGSNPIGLDRGNASSGDIVRFRRIGDKVVAEQENWRYRATSGRAAEEKSVQQSFANSFLWSTGIEAKDAEGRLLIDLTAFIVRDAADIGASLKFGKDAGDYRLAADRSMPDPAGVLSFPDNSEIDAFLTFESAKPNAQTNATGADGRAVTLVLHHSFVRLPEDGYTPRAFDQRTASIGMGYYDFSNPLGESIVTRLSPRFRLERVAAGAASGPVKKPIVFYVDSGAPPEIRDALIEGASWWAQGFEAAGFENAYRVEVLPEGVHPLDVRYNVINWTHRQTRGWSYGGSVEDPRTGEILKANVILGSQRVRQDRMIFEGLAGTAKTGTGAADDPIEISLARIRQLSAHEVGHTLGFAHNFAASGNGRASVMDYPAPWVKPLRDGTLDFSQAYAAGLGAWDMFTVKWLYTEFPGGGDDRGQLDAMVAEAYGAGLRFISDEHGRSVDTAHPYGSVWDNGDDPVAELAETLEVRRIALGGLGLGSLAPGQPTSDLNAVIVPIYLYHRYQIDAAAKFIGGLDFRYAVTGDGPSAATPVPAADQRRALEGLIDTLDPARLDLPDGLLNQLTPGDVGYAGGGAAQEVFPGRSGPVFDLAVAADTAAALTLGAVLEPSRANRLLAYEQRAPGGLSLRETLDALDTAVFAGGQDARRAPLARIVQARFVSEMIGLSRSEAASPGLDAVVNAKLAEMKDRFGKKSRGRTDVEEAHLAALSAQITRHLSAAEMALPIARPAPETPPGSPIGAMGQMEECWFCGN